MKRRTINVFSLSFLDVMFCGFGAVILFFMIINADSQARRNTASASTQEQVQDLQAQVVEAEQSLAQLQNHLQGLQVRQRQAQARAAGILQDIALHSAQLSEQQQEARARLQAVDALKAELKSLEKAYRQLEAGALQDEIPGRHMRAFDGHGQRQYLTGLKMDGERILILVDNSASMLADRIINVLRFRNLAADERVRAAKWQQVLHTVDWISTRLPPASQFQIHAFNEISEPLFRAPGTVWLDAGNPSHLDRAVAGLYEQAPGGGTNLYRAFQGAAQMDPPPDTIYLLTDGLPTQGRTKSWRSKVSAQVRKKLFDAALEVLPDGIPVNTILFHMEGDPQASSEYWKLASLTRGAFFSPSRDWP